VRLFTFGDDALPRPFVRSLTESAQLVPGVCWQAELRWDGLPKPPDLTPLVCAGATNLIFGLESGSDRVLRRMAKGATARLAQDTRAACARAGVAVNLQCFLGFPGETRQDMSKTLQFLSRVGGPRTTISCGIFELQKGSPVAHHPAAFGIRRTPPPPTQDLTVRFDYLPRPALGFLRKMLVRVSRLGTRLAPQLRCGISAHALVFLASRLPTQCSQVPIERTPASPLSCCPGVSFRVLRWDPESLKGKTPAHASATGYAFSLATSKVTRLGAVASAIVQQADGRTELAPILAGLDPSERQRVRRAVRRLTALGLLAPAAAIAGR
jgi:hypothetical protein